MQPNKFLLSYNNRGMKTSLTLLIIKYEITFYHSRIILSIASIKCICLQNISWWATLPFIQNRFQIWNWPITYFYWSSLALGHLITLLSLYHITNVFQHFNLWKFFPSYLIEENYQQHVNLHQGKFLFWRKGHIIVSLENWITFYLVCYFNLYTIFSK